MATQKSWKEAGKDPPLELSESLALLTPPLQTLASKLFISPILWYFATEDVGNRCAD